MASLASGALYSSTRWLPKSATYRLSCASSVTRSGSANVSAAGLAWPRLAVLSLMFACPKTWLAVRSPPGASGGLNSSTCIGSDQMGQGVAPSFGTLLSLIGSGCSRGLAPKGQPTAGRQRALLDGLPLAQNAFGASKVNIGRGDVVKRLVVALLVVVLDEADDCFF